jgi:ABC-2 type transport system permease protein
MTLLHLARKDLTRSLRSAFLLVMMFVVPLGLSGLMYFAFGGLGSGDGGGIATTRVLVVNHDPGVQGFGAGALLADLLSEHLGTLVDVSTADDEAAARADVDARRAGVALIIPAGFTEAALGLGPAAEAVMYADPTLTIGPGIVRGLVGQIADRLAGGRIAAETVQALLAERGIPLGEAELRATAEAFQAAMEGGTGRSPAAGGGGPLLTFQAAAEGPPSTAMQVLLGATVAGQMIFSAFFAAAYMAESVIREDEEGTLARLFTTPVRRAAILGGKALAAGVLVLGQTVILMLATRWALDIPWGRPGTLALLEVGLIVAAAGFGVFLLSFARTTRQSGAAIGAGITITGMLGGLFSGAIVDLPAGLRTVQLFLPQGWAMRGWMQALEGAGPAEVLVPVGAMLAMGGALFALGAMRFRRRFA